MPDQDALNRSLWDALLDSDWNAAQARLDAGASVNAVSASGEPMITALASRRNVAAQEATEWLLARGGNINLADQSGQTALTRAVQAQDVAMLERLIGWGADVNHRDRNGASVLLRAVLGRDPHRTVPVLLAAGADPNLVSTSGSTALLALAAAREVKQKPELLQALLDAGADPHALDQYGQGMAHALILGYSAHLLPQVLAHSPTLDIAKPAKSGSTPLGRAAEYHDLDAVHLLLDLGADPNVRTMNAFGSRPTPLMVLAGQALDPSVVTKAIARGADVNARDDKGRSVLCYALTGMSVRRAMRAPGAKAEASAPPESREEGLKLFLEGLEAERTIVEALVAAGADVAAPFDRTRASAYDRLLLLPQDQRAAWIDWAHGLGFSATPSALPAGTDQQPEEWRAELRPWPLTLALNDRDLDTVRRLVALGTPVALDPLFHQTALHDLVHVDLKGPEANAINLLAAKATRLSPEKAEPLVEQIKELRGKVKAFWAEAMDVLAAPSGIEVPDADGNTPLAWYAQKGHVDLVGLALDRGADPLALNAAGEPALVHALIGGNLELLHGLLAVVGSTPTLDRWLLDAAYSSPDPGLQRAAFRDGVRSLNGHPDLSRWLAATDENGNTPLIVAAATAQEDLVDLFLALGADPNVQDQAGNTALLHAMTQGKSDIVRALRSYGADTSLTNDAGLDARGMAQQLNQQHLYRAVQADVERLTPVPMSEALMAIVAKGQALFPTHRPSAPSRAPKGP